MRKQDRICGQRYAYAVDPGVLTCACICIPEIILEAESTSKGAPTPLTTRCVLVMSISVPRDADVSDSDIAGIGGNFTTLVLPLKCS